MTDRRPQPRSRLSPLYQYPPSRIDVSENLLGKQTTEVLWREKSNLWGTPAVTLNSGGIPSTRDSSLRSPNTGSSWSDCYPRKSGILTGWSCTTIRGPANNQHSIGASLQPHPWQGAHWNRVRQRRAIEEEILRHDRRAKAICILFSLTSIITTGLCHAVFGKVHHFV